MAADANTTPNPAVAPPANFDAKAMNETILAAVTAATKPLVDQIAALKAQVGQIEARPATTPPSGKDDPKSKDADRAEAGAALTADDVAKIVADALKSARDADTSDAKRLAARRVAIESELKGVPVVYHAALPMDSDDANTLSAAAKKIAEQYRTDLAAAGVKAPTIGATPGKDAQPVGGGVDVSKMSAVQKIGLAYQPAK